MAQQSYIPYPTQPPHSGDMIYLLVTHKGLLVIYQALTEEDEELDAEELREAAEEDWDEESRKAAERQAVEAIASCDPKDAPCLGYRDFFESM